MGSGSGAPTAKFAAAGPSSEETDFESAGVKLIVRRPDVPEVVIEVDKNEFLIGRLAAEADLVIDDDLVSRKHAILTVDERGYFRLTDLGSKNGITYAGRTVRRLNLLDGDVFKIGKTEIVFHAKVGRYASRPEAPKPRTSSIMANDTAIPSPEPEKPEGT